MQIKIKRFIKGGGDKMNIKLALHIDRMAAAKMGTLHIREIQLQLHNHL